MLRVGRELEVGLVLDEVGVRAQEAEGGTGDVGAVALVVDGRGFGFEVEMPEGGGEEVFGDGLEEDLVVDPDEVEVRVLGEDNSAALDELVRQGGDVAAVLGGEEPEVLAELVEACRY